MKPPKLKSAIHIEYEKVRKYFSSRFGFDDDFYWSTITESHTFHGSDSTRVFTNEFLEEVIDEKILTRLTMLSPQLVHILKLGSKEAMLSAILKTPPEFFLEEYRKVVRDYDLIIKILGGDLKGYYEFLLLGLVESAVVSHLKLKDCFVPQKYFYYFSY